MEARAAATKVPRSNVPWWAARAVALLAVLANVAVNYLSERTESATRAGTSREVSDAYPNLFTPAPYAFLIWGVVYASFVAFCVASLLPSQRENVVYDRLALPLVGMNVLASAWLMAFHAHSLVLSSALILLFVLVAADAFLVAHEAVARREIGLFVTGPFSLVFGWICVAAIANGAVLLVSLNVPAFTESAEVATMAMIGAAALTATLVSARFDDFVFPSAVGWATVAILLARRTDAPNVAIAALVGTLLCASAAMGTAFDHITRQRTLTPIEPSRRLRPAIRETIRPPYASLPTA